MLTIKVKSAAWKQKAQLRKARATENEKQLKTSENDDDLLLLSPALSLPLCVDLGSVQFSVSVSG